MTASYELRTLSTGHAYPEGPVLAPDGSLYAVDMAAASVVRVNGGRAVIAESPGAPNGAAMSPDGTIYVCNNGGNWGPNASTGGRAGLGGGTPRIQRIDPGHDPEDVLVEIDGRPLDAPNDIARDADGGLWFTDPVWAERDSIGRARAADSPPGAVCYLSPDGSAARVHEGLIFPNGIALTPDGAALIVGETGTGRLLRFPIASQGALEEPTVFSDLGVDAFPDGFAFDGEGRLVVAGTGSGALFVVGQYGELERRIEMRDPDVTNVCFAGEDGRVLVVTEASLGRVSAMAWDAPGEPLPGMDPPWSS